MEGAGRCSCEPLGSLLSVEGQVPPRGMCPDSAGQDVVLPDRTHPHPNSCPPRSGLTSCILPPPFFPPYSPPRPDPPQLGDQTSSPRQSGTHLLLQETRETWVRSLGGEDPLEEEMASHSGILACRIPRTEEPGRLRSMGLQSPS